MSDITLITFLMNRNKMYQNLPILRSSTKSKDFKYSNSYLIGNLSGRLKWHCLVIKKNSLIVAALSPERF